MLKSKKQREDDIGINGETYQILVTDPFTSMQFGATLQDKASLIEWIHHFLTLYSPTYKNKNVYLDQKGDLYWNTDVCNVFSDWHYDIYPTGTDSSHMNGPVERAHQSVGNCVRAFITGTNLVIKFWSYAFFNHICISNAFALAFG